MYCLGTNCALKPNCPRYQEGKSKVSSSSKDWIEHCSEEYREGYKPLK